VPENNLVEETPDAAARPRIGWASLAVAIAFGLLYAYDLWEAINNAIELPKQYAALEVLGVEVGEVPWTLIIANMLVPVGVYLLAFVLSLRRALFGRVVLFALGLALVAVLTLDIIAIA
jgi:uncharacterized membrane protein